MNILWKLIETIEDDVVETYIGHPEGKLEQDQFFVFVTEDKMNSQFGPITVRNIHAEWNRKSLIEFKFSSVQALPGIWRTVDETYCAFDSVADAMLWCRKVYELNG